MSDMDFSKEFMDLHINSPFSSDSINDDLENDEDDDIKYIKENKKKKKKKKDKKSFVSDKLDLLMEDIEMDSDKSFASITMTDEDDDYLITKKSAKGRKKDLFDIKEARKKKRKNIEARFNPELIELKKILKDANATYTDIGEILKNIKNSKSRYVGKTLTDLLQAMNSANTNRMNIVTHMANIKKTVTDLTLKQEKANPKKKDDFMDEEAMGLDIFRTLLGGKKGRKEFNESAKEYFNSTNISEDDDYEIIGDDENIDDIINLRLSKEKNERRSDEGNAYIQYEDYQPEDCIIYRSNNEWDIEAIDKNGNFMPDDYPRMNKKDLGQVSFDLEQNRARDEYGRLYKIIHQ